MQVTRRKSAAIRPPWKVRHGQPGRPGVPKDVRELIRKMSRENPLWGAPRIHGELLRLGIEIGETSVGKYMVRHREPPSQTWRTFLDNHVKQLVSIDSFTVPTIRFQVRIFGNDFTRQVKDMGIREVLAAPRSPGQRAYIERVIGSIRRECLDHVIIVNEGSLRRILNLYLDYYQASRTPLSLAKDSPEPRPVQPPEMGRVVAVPQVGGLHRRYQRRAREISGAAFFLGDRYAARASSHRLNPPDAATECVRRLVGQLKSGRSPQRL